MPKTHDEIYDAVLDVKEKMVHLSGDFVDLKGVVNDQLHDFRISLDRKVDQATLPLDLLKSLVFHALNNKYVRWGMGALLVSLIAAPLLPALPSWVPEIVKNFP